MSSIVLACRASSLDPLLLLFGHSAKERKDFSKAINDTYWARSKFLLELHVLDNKVLGLWMIKNQEHLKVDFRRLNFVSSISFLGNCQQLHMWNGTPLLPSATVVGGCGGVHPPRQTSTPYADTPPGRDTLPRADSPDTHTPRRPLQRTVRTLLECILIALSLFCSFTCVWMTKYECL